MSLRFKESSLWAAVGFYALIALEFIYMATPFAAFFYSAYSPLINFTNRYESLAWLNNTFLPHIVQQTKSVLLNSAQPVAVALFGTGMIGFCVGAAQVYYSKLFRKKAVTGGIYKFIRHPQYASLIVWGMGMTLLWPRTIVLLSFVTMMFIYYQLAATEERVCERKFGEQYLEYKKKTAMFLPVPAFIKIFSLPASGVKRYAAIIMLFLASVSAAVAVSIMLREWSIHSLYAVYERDAAYVSVTEMDDNNLQQIIRTVLSDPEVKGRLEAQGNMEEIYCLNYILPKELYMLEVPMHRDENAESHHFMNPSLDASVYKLIFTKAEVRGDSISGGEELLSRTTNRIPLLEVQVDFQNKKVAEIKEPPKQLPLAGVSLPLF